MGNMIVGIDPGTRNGLAVWHVDEARLVSVGTFSFWQMFDRLPPVDWVVLVVLEDASGVGLYARHQRRGEHVARRIARNVGANQRDAQTIYEYLRRHQYPVVRVPPVRAAKWNRATMERITGWTGPTSQHGRDAARLIYGMTRAHAEQMTRETP
jgi:hypothetical protein